MNQKTESYKKKKKRQICIYDAIFKTKNNYKSTYPHKY